MKISTGRNIRSAKAGDAVLPTSTVSKRPIRVKNSANPTMESAWIPSASAASESTLSHLVYAVGSANVLSESSDDLQPARKSK